MKMKDTIKLLLLSAVAFISTEGFAQVNESFKPQKERGTSMFSAIQEIREAFKIPSFKKKSLFDNSLEQIDVFTKDESDNLTKSYIENFSYSENGLAITRISQIFNLENQEWEQGSTFTLTFTEDGKPISFDGIFKFGTSKRAFNYNNEGQLISHTLVDDFDYGNGNVIKVEEGHTFTNHTDDSVSYIFKSSFNGEVQSRNGYFVQKGDDLQEVFSQTVSVGEVTDRIISYSTSLEQSMSIYFDVFYTKGMYHDYKIDNGDWTPYTREVQSFSGEQLISSEFQYYNDDSKSWNDGFKSEFEYDSKGNLTKENRWSYWDSWEIYEYLQFTYMQTISIESDESAKTFLLSQNYPNPFNPSTTINYSLNSAQEVSLKVFNILGKEVAELAAGFQSSGEYSMSFNASNLPSGIYYYTLKTSDFTETKSMTLLK
ncbi:MAG: hypothetical protein BalsKO_07490 [Balneolaceae bacterium]